MSEHQGGGVPYTGDERRSHPRDPMTVEEQAVDIVGGKYK